ncbi:MAG: dephospho-CoA kinase [Kordiimonadaceae bacterium]|nr:dephospho-CoA kinase [Kordiimonadaceae bacterium]MBT6035544.1 dephospho-CoA kinase [Kordiimonadaceae bacterium]MBT6330876.1 dephospho-CoA kinase [Kordiimonadaceae bacterium]
MRTIGLTGSIGMGKTETAKMFAARGIPVFDSDAAAHTLLGPSGAAVEMVEKTFPGVKIDQQIDRKLLGQRVFNDSEALSRLENILHPMIQTLRDDFSRNTECDLVLFDIPLLFEKGYEADLDYSIVVSAPYEIQKERVLERPAMTEDRFKEILKKQMLDEEKRGRADFIIETGEGLQYAEKQVDDILKKLRKN